MKTKWKRKIRLKESVYVSATRSFQKEESGPHEKAIYEATRKLSKIKFLRKIRLL